MDADVLTSSLGMLGLALLASVFGYRLSHILSPGPRLALLAITMILASLYASFLVGRLEMIHLLPNSAAIFATNFTPVLILFSAGLAWSIPGAAPRSRQMRFTAMAVLSIVFFFAPLLRPWLRPVISDAVTKFDTGVCLQSHSASCGAAAAATLLHCHGIPVSEIAMIEACLTSRDGTEPLGLYRGLASSTKNRRIKPTLASRNASDWKQQQQFPLVALVTFRHDIEIGAGGFRRMLGRQAEGHAIVVFGQSDNGDFIIGDPAVGRTVWDQRSFNRRFSGQALYLAKR